MWTSCLNTTDTDLLDFLWLLFWWRVSPFVLISHQMPPKRDEAALQEEEELQLAIALSQSEAEEKERMVGFHDWSVQSLEVPTLDSANPCSWARLNTTPWKASLVATSTFKNHLHVSTEAEEPLCNVFQSGPHAGDIFGATSQHPLHLSCGNTNKRCNKT